MARGRNAEPDLEQGGEIVLMQFLSLPKFPAVL